MASRRSIAPSLEASQQKHITDLVQKNRALETENKKLRKDLDLERSRAKEAVKDLQTAWHEEVQEVFDVLQTCHELSEIRTVGSLEQERTKVLREQEVTRQEKVARIQRDFQITMFQIRESELTSHIEDLEDEKEELVRKYTRKIGRLNQQLEGSASNVAELETKLGDVEKEKDAFEVSLLFIYISRCVLRTSAPQGTS